MGAGRLCNHASPKLVLFSKARLNFEVREQVLNVRLFAAVVASMSRDSFAEKLFNGRDERIVMRELQVGEGDVGGAQTASQWRGVV